MGIPLDLVVSVSISVLLPQVLRTAVLGFVNSIWIEKTR
jgi:hypothetical protein